MMMQKKMLSIDIRVIIVYIARLLLLLFMLAFVQQVLPPPLLRCCEGYEINRASKRGIIYTSSTHLCRKNKKEEPLSHGGILREYTAT